MENISIAVRRQQLKLNSRTYIQIILFPSVRGPRGGKAALNGPPTPSQAPTLLSIPPAGGRRREAIANEPRMAANTQESR